MRWGKIGGTEKRAKGALGGEKVRCDACDKKSGAGRREEEKRKGLKVGPRGLRGALRVLDQWEGRIRGNVNLVFSRRQKAMRFPLSRAQFHPIRSTRDTVSLCIIYISYPPPGIPFYTWPASGTPPILPILILTHPSRHPSHPIPPSFIFLHNYY